VCEKAVFWTSFGLNAALATTLAVSENLFWKAVLVHN
jgi:hypothetical protein